MLRISMSMLLFYALAAPASALAPFRAAGSPEAKKSAPAADSPQRIIDELRSNFDRVGSDFEKKQPGLQTRQAQQRIIDGIDKLLEQQDPAPSSNKSFAAAKNQPAHPPSAQKPAPKPMPAAKQPAKTTEIGGRPGEKPGTPADFRQPTPSSDSWSLPPRHRDQIDAHQRERFIRNYSEILREYYRALAESTPRKDRD